MSPPKHVMLTENHLGGSYHRQVQKANSCTKRNRYETGTKPVRNRCETRKKRLLTTVRNQHEKEGQNQKKEIQKSDKVGIKKDQQIPILSPTPRGPHEMLARSVTGRQVDRSTGRHRRSGDAVLAALRRYGPCAASPCTAPQEFFCSRAVRCQPMTPTSSMLG